MNAIIILHEIYGINAHIEEVCAEYRKYGYDVYCPNLLGGRKPFQYDEQEIAYTTFVGRGFGKAYELVKEMSLALKLQYENLILVGLSVGGTLAWQLSDTGIYNGIVAYYGSRIRDRLDIRPECETLLIFAKHETAFNPQDILHELKAMPNVTMTVLEGNHGFMDAYSENYNAMSAAKAKQMTDVFLNKIFEQQEAGK
jgi:dienelactone hydrolase